MFDSPLADGTVVMLDLQPTAWSVTCGEDADCSAGILFEGLRADRVEVVIITPSGEQRHVLVLEYREIYANGPECPGLCYLAEVSLAVA